ncbi:peptide-methionine (S)-S-oxide reductase MsrA [Leptothrix discophora]|uniref:Peptide methionine sulfoxide reductase MsrA n=1 Tax=Leptothrix discophora TaxID=89 RepID=A0ABT9G0U6_LEPDI|nr:peptide-methionine (S)-S-oxide reductase MsrA [Leptothrix discophora]MDP4300081.1 peptide-methionine (S)-S-oxide reductase MsrA [Leptothrix discophora]
MTVPIDPPFPAPAESVITLGGGCFWCTEAVFLQVRGVRAVESGYCNGHVVRPTYEAVCQGDTGHAEVVRLRFDPAQVDLSELLQIFFAVHDPTTLNRQGHDVGTQYRSGIYWHAPEQVEVAQAVMREAAEAWQAPIVTELLQEANYWPAEAYHQRYYERHPHQGYCAHVIAPKLAKFRKVFARLQIED